MPRVAALLLLGSFALAQAPAPPPQQAPAAATVPEARLQDVDTIDHIVAALYDVISGPAGAPRDWNRFRSLFIPEARLIPNGVREGAAFHRVLLVDEFAQRSAQNTAQNGFFESETARQQQRFGAIAHVFSTYESRREKAAAPFARGINSIQLLYDGKRWYLATIVWDSERPDNPIPPAYRAAPPPAKP